MEMEMEGHDSDQDGSMSNEELSDVHDDESDGVPRTRAEVEANILAKLKAQVRQVDRARDNQPAFPLPFPFPHPAAFLPPVPPYPTAPPRNSSGSSHSSESSSSSQQHTWSFEEQFKQVRQLYEITDDPKRKEFLDDLFSFMQRRGTPINRLPIMAKSVLDLHELYNLVIARGGLVDVINKKLWQEIIKGLHLPSSITSAAFTLRTQYMKYLYPYESEKRNLSTPTELQAAIDGNRREGRRTSYGSYPDMMRRSPTNPPMHMNQLGPLGHLRPQMNGNGIMPQMPQMPQLPHPALHPALAQPPVPANPMSAMNPADFEARMVEYVRMLNNQVQERAPHLSPPSPPTSTSPREGLSALDMGRLQLWNLYNNNHTNTPTPEPQKEALDLGVKEDPKPVVTVKREPQETVQQNGQSSKNELPSPEPPKDENEKSSTGSTHIKIASSTETRNRDGSLDVSMEINGVTYTGVLFAKVETAH